MHSQGEVHGRSAVLPPIAGDSATGEIRFKSKILSAGEGPMQEAQRMLLLLRSKQTYPLVLLLLKRVLIPNEFDIADWHPSRPRPLIPPGEREIRTHK
jgi:hypothetical protein